MLVECSTLCCLSTCVCIVPDLQKQNHTDIKLVQTFISADEGFVVLYTINIQQGRNPALGSNG